MFEEIDENALRRLADHEEVIVFLYTPLCGTCKLAEKMLYITRESMEHPISVFKCNISFIPEKAQAWEIESVPCMIILHDGRVYDKIYAFHSVDYLYRYLTRHRLSQ